jgi:lysyl-tRNA synthetase class 2
VNEQSHPMFDPANLTDQELARLRNLEGLIAAGITPYPARTRRTHTTAAARDLFERGEAGEQPVSVAGRIKRVRVMGKMSFADLEDGAGTLQIVLRSDNLPARFLR